MRSIMSLVIIIVLTARSSGAPCEVPCYANVNNQRLRSNSTSSNNLDVSEKSDDKVEKKRKKCCPYDFNSKLCRVVGDRILCGYNRNVGTPGLDESKELSDDCRIRGGRVECGYKGRGPFVNKRRPSLWNELEDLADIKNASKLNYIEPSQKPLKNISKCLEIKDSIVCGKTSK